MATPDTPQPAHEVDPAHDRSGNPFDTDSGYSGQEYSQARERELERSAPSGHPLGGDPRAVAPSGEDPQGRDIPPESGRRGSFDPKTGEAHGSGSRAGGGNAGEEFDSGTPGA